MIGEWSKTRVFLAEDPKTLATVDFLRQYPLFCSWARLAFGFPGERYGDADAKPLPITTHEILDDFVARRMHAVWRRVEEFYRQDGEDAVVDLAEPSAIDIWAGNVPGFGAAMVAGQWVFIETNVDGHPALRFPNFREWNKLRKGSAAAKDTSAATPIGSAATNGQRPMTSAERSAKSRAKKTQEAVEAALASAKAAQPAGNAPATDAQPATAAQAHAGNANCSAATTAGDTLQRDVAALQRETDQIMNRQEESNSLFPSDDGDKKPESANKPGVEKKTRKPNPRFDRIAEMSGIPSPIRERDAKRITLTIKALDDDPVPYTLEDLNRLPAAVAAAGMSFTLTPENIAKWIYLVRGKPTTIKGVQHGRSNRPVDVSRVHSTRGDLDRLSTRLSNMSPAPAPASADATHREPAACPS